MKNNSNLFIKLSCSKCTFKFDRIQVNYHLGLVMSKEQERAELHRVIWRIAEDLRGSVDGWALTTFLFSLS